METLFLICAVVGGTTLVCQFAMTLLGLSGHDADFGSHDIAHDFGGHDGHSAAGHHHDPQHDQHGSTWWFGIVTFRTVVAAIAFFGLAGMAATQNGSAAGVALVMGLAAGAAAMLGVHALMKSLHQLRADGTLRVERAVGAQGTVYLPVPASNSGAGKVQVHLQNRLVELQAMTPGQEKLPCGMTIVVTAVLGPDLVEVQPVSSSSFIEPPVSSSHV